ncbi:MAG: hypothetical protein AB7E96_09885 [Deferribacterales bacterium]
MKSIATALLLIAFFAVSAFAQVQMDEAKFEKWVKGMKVPAGYKYEDTETSEEEFTANFYKKCGQGMCAVMVKVDRPEKFEMYKNDKTIKDVKLTQYGGKKALYYAYKNMNLSSVIVDVPEIKGKVTVSFSPAFSSAEMEKALKGIGIEKLR